jgi:hypothetical protein
MVFGEISLSELPDVNDVAIENEDFGLNGFEVRLEFGSVAAIRSEMNIRDDYNSGLTLGHKPVEFDSKENGGRLRHLFPDVRLSAFSALLSTKACGKQAICMRLTD